MGQMVERVYDSCTAAVLTVRRFHVKTPAVILCCPCEETVVCMEEQRGCQRERVTKLNLQMLTRHDRDLSLLTSVLSDWS